MFVCICNAYRDHEIAAAARAGARSAEEAYEALGNGPNCGCCLEAAEEIVREAGETALASDRSLT